MRTQKRATPYTTNKTYAVDCDLNVVPELLCHLDRKNRHNSRRFVVREGELCDAHPLCGIELNPVELGGSFS